MPTLLEKFKTVIGAESNYNDFIFQKNTFGRTLWNIFKVAAFRVFIETNSSDKTPYELEPEAVLKEEFSLGRIWDGYTQLNSGPKKVLFGIGAYVSFPAKIPEFIAYFFTLLLHAADDYLATRKFQILGFKPAQLLRIFTIPLLIAAGLAKLAASVASPLTNAMRLIKARYPKSAFLVMILSSIAIGFMLNATGLAALALAATPLGVAILGLGALAAGVIFAATTILAFNMLTKSFSSGFFAEARRNSWFEDKILEFLKEHNVENHEAIAKETVACLLEYENKHDIHFNRNELQKHIQEKLNDSVLKHDSTLHVFNSSETTIAKNIIDSLTTQHQSGNIYKKAYFEKDSFDSTPTAVKWDEKNKADSSLAQTEYDDDPVSLDEKEIDDESTSQSTKSEENSFIAASGERFTFDKKMAGIEAESVIQDDALLQEENTLPSQSNNLLSFFRKSPQTLTVETSLGESSGKDMGTSSTPTPIPTSYKLVGTQSNEEDMDGLLVNEDEFQKVDLQ